jgi:hypothetical protein
MEGADGKVVIRCHKQSWLVLGWLVWLVRSAIIDESRLKGNHGVLLALLMWGRCQEGAW